MIASRVAGLANATATTSATTSPTNATTARFAPKMSAKKMSAVCICQTPRPVMITTPAPRFPSAISKAGSVSETWIRGRFATTTMSARTIHAIQARVACTSRLAMCVIWMRISAPSTYVRTVFV